MLGCHMYIGRPRQRRNQSIWPLRLLPSTSLPMFGCSSRWHDVQARSQVHHTRIRRVLPTLRVVPGRSAPSRQGQRSAHQVSIPPPAAPQQAQASQKVVVGGTRSGEDSGRHDPDALARRLRVTGTRVPSPLPGVLQWQRVPGSRDGYQEAFEEVSGRWRTQRLHGVRGRSPEAFRLPSPLFRQGQALCAAAAFTTVDTHRSRPLPVRRGWQDAGGQVGCLP